MISKAHSIIRHGGGDAQRADARVNRRTSSEIVLQGFPQCGEIVAAVTCCCNRSTVRLEHCCEASMRAANVANKTWVAEGRRLVHGIQ